MKESGETPRRDADSGGPDGTFPHATPKTDLEQKFKFAFWSTDCEPKNEKDEIAARLTPGRKGIHTRGATNSANSANTRLDCPADIRKHRKPTGKIGKPMGAIEAP